MTNVCEQQNYIPRITWFETEENTPITINKYNDMSFVFDL